MPLRADQTFGGYRIVRPLGSGGMGEVYLAQHPRLPRRDALKVLPSELAADPDYRARFERESDLAATLWHPNIVGVHDRGDSDGRLWIAMDFVDGLDAGRLLAEHYPAGMPADLVVWIITAVASALDYANKQGLLHRDVKPANIMITRPDDGEDDRRILLADFGIARVVGDISGLTATNMTVGTVAYSAPEQLMGDDLDGRADQYALAATAYHLLTASLLFLHSNPAVVISRHLNADPPLLSASKPDLAAMDYVLARALAKDPRDRFSRCSDFAEELSRAALGQAESQRAQTLAAAPQQPAQRTKSPDAPAIASASPPRPRSRLRAATVIPVVLGALLLVVPTLVVLLLRRDHGSPPQHAAGDTSRPPSDSPSAPPAAGTPAVALPPVAAPTTTASRYAIPACYSLEDPPVERPTTVIFEYCGDGGAQLDHMTWTSWGPSGADGQGYFSVRTCKPNCAQGGLARFPAEIHATNPAPLLRNSGCPSDMQFYTDLTLAFPMVDPGGINGQTVNSQYNGLPAIRFSTEPNQADAKQLTQTACW